MLDARIRPIIDPGLKVVARWLANARVSPNQVTWTGFVMGMLAVPAIWQEWHLLALGLLLLNRLADGIDGALARLVGVTDLGGYLDIVLDFIVYSAIVFGFCLSNPEQAIYGAFLIFSFIGNGSSFLAFAIMAERRGIQTERQGKKSLYYLSGLAEGFETIVILGLMCLFPQYFWLLALLFGGLCWLSATGRIWQASHLLSVSK